ncbi:MAG: glycosyltransferase family 39 protein [Planctomycetes bacterium]|nr:glycosyltransferase family 39 protein [Planctomycetota bacterium]
MLKKYIRAVFVIVIYLVVAFFILTKLKMPPHNLKKFLSIYFVYLLELNFFLLVIAFIVNFKYIKEIFAGIEKKHLLLLASISIIGIFTTSFIAPRTHRIYFDEDIYNNIGQSIADSRKAVMSNEGYYENGELKVISGEYNKQPLGYPYLVSVVFRIFGTNELFSFILNNILLGLTVVVIFLIVFLFFRDTFAGLIACLSYIFIPVNLHWFNTCAVEPSTAFFTSVTVLALSIYIKNKKPINMFFFATALAFSLNFRPESFLIVIVIGLTFLLKDVKVFVRKELYIFGTLLFLLLSGVILHLYMVRGQDWGSGGAKFAMDHLAGNFRVNSMFYLDNERFPLLFSILGVIGLLFYKNKSYIKGKAIILCWFLLFWGIFLFFYAGSYKFGQDVRFSVLSYVPFSIFVGLGVSFIRNLLGTKVKSISLVLILLIILNFTWFLPFTRAVGDEAWASRIGHKYAVEFARLLPENSIVFTHNPNIFLLNRQSAIQSSTATYNSRIVRRYLDQFKGGVYVHYNYWSNVNDPTQKVFTENILNRYDCQTIKEYHYRNFKYGLYKIKGPKQH